MCYFNAVVFCAVIGFTVCFYSAIIFGEKKKKPRVSINFRPARLVGII